MEPTPRHMCLPAALAAKRAGINDLLRDDLESAGMLALAVACRNYRPSGATFDTFAYTVVDRAIIARLLEVNRLKRGCGDIPVSLDRALLADGRRRFADGRRRFAWIYDKKTEQPGDRLERQDLLARAEAACEPEEWADLVSYVVDGEHDYQSAARQGVCRSVVQVRRRRAVVKARAVIGGDLYE